MKVLLGVLTVSVAALATPAMAAADGAPLAQKGGCVACHSIDKKMLGPSYKDIAAKYKGKDAEAMLIKKVKEGGSGVWGAVPMPANGNKLSDPEYKTVVSWILAQ
jgi:cytochrome c